MKILMCHNFYAQEGGENGVFRQEAKILEAAGHAVRLYARDSKELTTTAARLAAVAASVHAPRTARELTAVVAEFRPDVALVQNVFPLLSPAVYTTLERHGVPIVQLVFNYRFLCANAQLFVDGAVCERCVHGSTINAVVHRCMHGSRAISLWYAGLLGLHRRLGTFRRTIRRFVVPHEFVGRKLVEGGFDAARIRVVPNPFTLPPVSPEDVGAPYVIYVGRVVPEKGVLTLVQALERTPPPLRVVIVGDGPELPVIRAYLAARPELAARVECTGGLWGEPVQKLMAGAMALVLPSLWHDVSPLLLYNALAMGKPAIASHLGSMPDIVSDGVDGFIFPAGDVAALAERLERVARDPALRRRLGTAGRAKAESRFAAEVHYAALSAVLDEVVSRSS